jgi:hypothetical protein
LLHVFQHPDHHVAAALDHAKHRWFFGCQGTPAACAL